MHRSLPWLLAVAITVAVAARPAAAAELKTDDDKTLYALGLVLSNNLATFALSHEELEIVKEGLSDGVLGKDKKVPLETFGPKIQDLAKARGQKAAAAEKEKSKDFLEKAAKEKGANRTSSGLVYSEIKPGDGESPKATDTVKVHYHGTLTDGTVFDSSVQRGEPISFPLRGVIPCWTEGVQMMKVGGKSKLICPSDIAYGDRGSPPKIKPGATLVFEVELLGIEKTDKKP
jgi:FKBP-type peptidyl-prolyl cis-trans isomerase FkpA